MCSLVLYEGKQRVFVTEEEMFYNFCNQAARAILPDLSYLLGTSSDNNAVLCYISNKSGPLQVCQGWGRSCNYVPSFCPCTKQGGILSIFL